MPRSGPCRSHDKRPSLATTELPSPLRVSAPRQEGSGDLGPAARRLPLHGSSSELCAPSYNTRLARLPDAREGIESFLAKRSLSFTGQR